MFTGLISDVGEVVAASEPDASLRRLRIRCAYEADGIARGASIACAGPCLTVVAAGRREDGAGAWFEVDVAAETLACTTAHAWRVGSRLNLERSLKVGDELGGHLVTGHIDGVATVVARDDVGEGATARFVIGAPRELMRFVAEKGSIALDGTSLAVNAVDRNTFSVLLIPHSLAVTTWGQVKAGDRLNLEVDLMARYAARLAEARAAGY